MGEVGFRDHRRVEENRVVQPLKASVLTTIKVLTVIALLFSRHCGPQLRQRRLVLDNKLVTQFSTSSCGKQTARQITGGARREGNQNCERRFGPVSSRLNVAG